MKQISLADVPCEVTASIQKSELGVRLVEILKKIDFPNRDKFILSFTPAFGGTSGYLSMSHGVIDTKTGAPICLGHHVAIDNSMNDDRIARACFILIGQFVFHEFAETFRYQGQIMYDPHEGNHERNKIIFKAIEQVAEPIHKKEMFLAPIKVVVDEMPTEKQSTPASENETGDKNKKTHPFVKFLPKAWQERRKAA